MILLSRHDQGEGRVVAVFGLGLIGRAILAALRRSGGWSQQQVSFDWQDAALRVKQVTSIRRLFGEIDSSGPESARRIDIVWAAGKAGFGATQEQLALEAPAFESVLKLAEDLTEEMPASRCHFHLVSSAGGLFEGQRLVGRDTIPAPRRPYGEAKLAQENRLAHLRPEVISSIYRPSSVYGFTGPGGRSGLITALIQNALAHRVSYIFGDSNTIRDYVLADDIGNFIAGRIAAEPVTGGTMLLASGKATSITEVLHLVQKVVSRRLLLRFERNPSNADHMSFLSGALPEGWQPAALETGIRQTARDLLYRFATDNA